jgi:hypothetical protein
MAITFRANKGEALTYSEMDKNLGSYFYSSSLDGNNLYLHYTGSLNVPINQGSHRIPLTAGTVQGATYNVQYNELGNLAGAPDFIYSGSKVGINNTVNDLTYSLEVSGSIRASAAVLSNSDERLKENIYPIDNALSRVGQIEGVYFDWKKGGDRQVGVIAQQVEKVLPEVVSQDKDSYLSVDYSKIVPLLIEAINEQNSIIMDLEERISKLEK